MDDDLRATPASETKYGSVDIDDSQPTDCVLCGFAGDSHEDYNEHMQEVHGL
jgi:hypothetical protein